MPIFLLLELLAEDELDLELLELLAEELVPESLEPSAEELDSELEEAISSKLAVKVESPFTMIVLSAAAFTSSSQLLNL